jgi:DNA polymerase III subunit epsilon
MRQIILDTETTGIGPEQGHRIIEIGCVEMIDRRITGEHFHIYINPERAVDEGAFKVHGISNAFLSDKPVFQDILPDFIRFVDGAELVIHNAPFDMGFLNSELRHCDWRQTLDHHCTVLDTLDLARKKHPGQRNSLDALCKRYDIDNSNRELHGALLDAEILAYVYLAMTGGQISLLGELAHNETHHREENTPQNFVLEHPLVTLPSQEELDAHTSFVQMICEKSGIDRFSDKQESS